MSLFTYFQPKSCLPLPDGPLLKSVPSSSIVAANQKVKELLETEEKEKGLQCKRGTYECFTPEEKARRLPEKNQQTFLACNKALEYPGGF